MNGWCYDTFLLFNILFSIKVCLYGRINSILKVMCIFSRRELFIIPSVQSLQTRQGRAMFRICVITLPHLYLYIEYCMTSVIVFVQFVVFGFHYLINSSCVKHTPCL